ncbi:type 2 glycerol-3-phosphate oxidase [Mycoplasma crocodyli]|uniref:Glycerol-3-phosphate dehydrogenase n=1 Tax=Mycoplasma crocodyli (strain ATCC 51981 / MP145) TaxID=512564 RepID=D5E6H2_MYCCM|nr:type 2 glycerol-3-phosphate oxidase [Mycoplasma crocodyli]ADE19783.1 glycerol-3-phosphate dehydrogenase [Mycoplasma crocodyli MP145]
MKKYDVAIIGGGIIGASVAYELSKYDVKTVILEKNPVLGSETSLANTGLIHGGFDPEPHKIEAWMNVKGNRKWVNTWFKHLTFPRVKVDSLICAFNEEEMKHIHMLYDRGLINKVKAEDMQILNSQEIQKREPNLSKEIIGGLLCTSSWAIAPVEATKALVGASLKNNLTLMKNSTVTKIEKNREGFFEISIEGQEKILARKVVDAAGHYADVIANENNFDDFKQTTKRGEYRVLTKYINNLVNSVVFMVPTIHGKGVVVAPTLDGHYIVGPTAEDGVPKEETRLVTREKYDYIGKIGKKLIPNLDVDKTMMTLAGSRPIDVETNDFVIRKSKNDKDFILAAGMQSPALSSAPIIAEEVVKLLEMNLKKNENWDPKFEVIS